MTALNVKTYPNGQTVRIRVSFSDGEECDPEAVDPSTVTLKVKDPDDNVTAYVYNTDEEVIREEAGEYYADLPVDVPGTWHYRWEGTGAFAGVDEWRFIVAASAF